MDTVGSFSSYPIFEYFLNSSLQDEEPLLSWAWKTNLVFFYRLFIAYLSPIYRLFIAYFSPYIDSAVTVSYIIKKA